MTISRRDILKSLTMTAVAGSVLRVIPLEAAEYAHRMVRAEKAAADNQAYTPKFFSAHSYKTLQNLCQTIIPADGDAKGAMEAGAGLIQAIENLLQQLFLSFETSGFIPKFVCHVALPPLRVLVFSSPRRRYARRKNRQPE